MTKGDMHPGDIAVSLGLLTRLPLPVQPDFTRGARAAWAYPLAGLALALVAGAISLFAFWLGLTPAVTAALALATTVILTGAMHEDGLADTADGFWGGWDVARRLEIMKDSRIGTYGVLGLGLSLILRWAALTALFAEGQILGPLIATACLSRAAMPALMTAMPHARTDGLSRQTGRPTATTTLIGMSLAIIIALLAMNTGALLAALWVAIAATGLALIANRKIGGQTGDILGATQQVSEIAALLAFVALLP